MKALTVSIWTLLGLSFQLAACQSPGPDWPNCAAKSRGLVGRFGWEIWNFRQSQYIEGREDATNEILLFEAINTADGSITTCQMWDPNGANASLILDSHHFDHPLDNGNPTEAGCVTEWGYATARAPSESQVRVIYRPTVKELTIMHNWTCRESDGHFTTFSSNFTENLPLECSLSGREGERGACYFAGNMRSGFADYTLLPPPPKITSTSPPDTTPSPVSESTHCLTPAPTWHIESFWYHPPGPHPKDGEMWPASLSFELRNLADESKTQCRVIEWTDPAAEFTLKSNPKDCREGRWSDRNPSLNETVDRETARWVWRDPAEASFDPKTNTFSLNQTWTCPNPTGSGNVTVSGEVHMAFQMGCIENPDRYWLAPKACKPLGMIDVTTSGGPLLLGPGKAVVLGGPV